MGVYARVVCRTNNGLPDYLLVQLASNRKPKAQEKGVH